MKEECVWSKQGRMIMHDRSKWRAVVNAWVNDTALIIIILPSYSQRFIQGDKKGSSVEAEKSHVCVLSYEKRREEEIRGELSLPELL